MDQPPSLFVTQTMDQRGQECNELYILEDAERWFTALVSVCVCLPAYCVSL